MMNLKKLVSGTAALALAAALSLGGASASACLEPSPFEDVSYSDFHFSPISYCYYGDLMKGVTPARFEPEAPVNRAMVAVTLYRAAGEGSGSFQPGENAFVDVAPGSWYANAVNWAKAEGLISGVGGGRFAPNQEITRQDLAVILYRRAGEPYKDWAYPPTYTEELADYGDIAPYARLAVEWACLENYLAVQEEDGVRKLLPQASVTRADLAEALMKATYNVLTPLHFSEDMVESIEITSLYTNQTVTVTDPESLSKLVEQFNGYQAKDVCFPKEEELAIYPSYRVQVNEAISQPGTTTFYIDPSGFAVIMTTYGLHALYGDPDQLPPPGDGGKNIFEEYFEGTS